MSIGVYWWRALLVLGALGLAWGSLVNGLAGYYADRVATGEGAMIDHALGWQPDQSATLFLKALRVLPDDPDRGVRLLEDAYRANPSDPRPLIALAARSLEDGDVERSEALIELAGRLAPVDPRVQLAAAAYWWQRERYDRMLGHWSTALEADASQRKILFPDLLKIAESLEYRALLGSTAVSPPSWWTDYFRYVARTAVDTDTVRFLYALRRQSASEPPTPDERAVYVERLQKDGAIAEAYVIWLSGLNDTERRQLGLLYDGGSSCRSRGVDLAGASPRTRTFPPSRWPRVARMVEPPCGCVSAPSRGRSVICLSRCFWTRVSTACRGECVSTALRLRVA
ncbi:hypothetical protein [Thiocapsa sp.]|uniref:tetratricopeptide repeat protein n=1 Tax=Thiocapsa sp. TaxID=2024551 RepID=UPI001BCFD2BB|nr:hypothetical protein [Thiocapsa sp.]